MVGYDGTAATVASNVEPEQSIQVEFDVETREA